MAVNGGMAQMAREKSARAEPSPGQGGHKMRARGLNCWYGDKQALFDIDMEIPANRVTALIGPSGCGKSTFLRCLNRMNDVIEGCRIDGVVELDGEHIYDEREDPLANVVDVYVSNIRRKLGRDFVRTRRGEGSITYRGASGESTGPGAGR